MCTVILPPGVNPIAVNKYIIYRIILSMNDTCTPKLALRILSRWEKKRGSTKEEMYRAAPMKVEHAWNS